MSKRHKIVTLTAEQRSELEALVRAHSTPQVLALRARIVLLCADGVRPVDIVPKTGAVLRTVHEWRRRFERFGVAGLLGRKPTGRPVEITQEKIDEILRATVEHVPHEGTHWSQRLMAKHAGVSRGHVIRVWKAAGLQPHRRKTFKISRDP
jgi:transposase